MSKPIVIDICCGLGGWAEGLLATGWDVIGFDIERHVYGEHKYPAQLVIQDVLTLHGSQFKNADLIVASPPCQEYSYMAMPWSRAKAKAAAIRADKTGTELERLNRLFNACFRIQREACEAAGRRIPLIVENVRGAEPWVGKARWNYGSFYLWGDIPALMPAGKKLKAPGQENMRDGFKHTRRLTNPFEREGLKRPGIDLSDIGFNVANAQAFAGMVSGASYKRSADDKRQHIGITRKFASAMIAKIPLPLSHHIGMTFLPERARAA
jgi:hypothetical protein